MLAKNHKLHLKKDLDVVYKCGAKINSSSLYISVYKNLTRNLSDPRIAVFTPKKQFKKANERNRAKRRLFEIVRLNYSSFPKGYDFIIFAKKEVLSTEYKLLEKEVLDLLPLFGK